LLNIDSKSYSENFKSNNRRDVSWKNVKGFLNLEDMNSIIEGRDYGRLERLQRAKMRRACEGSFIRGEEISHAIVTLTLNGNRFLVSEPLTNFAELLWAGLSI
jgi:hypothetical protein